MVDGVKDVVGFIVWLRGSRVRRSIPLSTGVVPAEAKASSAASRPITLTALDSDGLLVAVPLTVVATIPEPSGFLAHPTIGPFLLFSLCGLLFTTRTLVPRHLRSLCCPCHLHGNDDTLLRQNLKGSFFECLEDETFCMGSCQRCFLGGDQSLVGEHHIINQRLIERQLVGWDLVGRLHHDDWFGNIGLVRYLGHNVVDILNGCFLHLPVHGDCIIA